MSEPLKLPPLTTTTLADATREQLFTDLAACAQITAIHPRVPNGQMPPAITLEAARVGMQSGAIKGLQIHYRYDGKTWRDTLIATPVGTRLVRICEEDIAATIQPADDPV